MKNREVRYFQYVVGDEIGEVRQLDHMEHIDEDLYYVFTDGSMCMAQYVCPMTDNKKKLKDKFMVEVPDTRNTWRLKKLETKTFNLGDGRYAEAPPLEELCEAPAGKEVSLSDSLLGKTILLPPERGVYPRPLPKEEEWLDEPGMERSESVEEAQTPMETAVEVSGDDACVNDALDGTPQETCLHESPRPSVPTPPAGTIGIVRKEDMSGIASNPAYLITKKTKKTECEISFIVKMSLPPKSVFKFIQDNCDGGPDTEAAFVQAVMEDIDPSLIMNGVRDAIMASYKAPEE